VRAQDLRGHGRLSRRVPAVSLLVFAALVLLPSSSRAATVTIEMHDDNTFEPARASTSVGDTVVWVNRGTIPHTATLQGVFDSGFVPARGRYEVVADADLPAEFEYVCTLHVALGMRGSLAVQGATGAAPPAGEEPAPEVSPSPSPLSGDSFAARWWERTSNLPLGLRLLAPIALALFLLLCGLAALGYRHAVEKAGQE
jgi:plastocyanin